MDRPDERPAREPTGQQRLIGLGLIVGGLAALGAVYLLWRYAPFAVPAPPGLPTSLLPLASPLNCILPVTAVGASFLVLVGLRKLILGE